MQKPKILKQIIFLMWMFIIMSIMITMIENYNEKLTKGEFYFSILWVAFFTIFPIKLNDGNNSVRYIFTISMLTLTIITIGNNLKSLTNIIGWIAVASVIYIVYGLFNKESNEYFNYIKEKK
jgi:hypothetical protein